MSRIPWFVKHPLPFLLLVTLLFSAVPFVFYIPARWSGSIPSPDVWWSRPGNHGPWWGSSLEWVVAGPVVALMLLFVGSLIFCLATLPARTEKTRWLLAGFGLVSLQAALLMLIANTVFWTVD